MARLLSKSTLVLGLCLMSAGSLPSAQSNFECPKETEYRKERVAARKSNDPFFPQFAQFEEYCERKVDGALVKDGPYKVWGPNGEKQVEGQYVNGRKEGKWIRRIPSQTLEDTWSKGEFGESKVLNEPRSYVIDFAACIPHEYNIPAALGSTSYRLIGKQRGSCVLRYSIDIERSLGPPAKSTSCFVTTKKGKLVFHNTQVGIDFSAIAQYCKR
jgi:hypothetical protein